MLRLWSFTSTSPAFLALKVGAAALAALINIHIHLIRNAGMVTTYSHALQLVIF